MLLYKKKNIGQIKYIWTKPTTLLLVIAVPFFLFSHINCCIGCIPYSFLFTYPFYFLCSARNIYFHLARYRGSFHYDEKTE